MGKFGKEVVQIGESDRRVRLREATFVCVQRHDVLGCDRACLRLGSGLQPRVWRGELAIARGVAIDVLPEDLIDSGAGVGGVGVEPGGDVAIELHELARSGDGNAQDCVL